MAANTSIIAANEPSYQSAANISAAALNVIIPDKRLGV